MKYFIAKDVNSRQSLYQEEGEGYMKRCFKAEDGSWNVSIGRVMGSGPLEKGSKEITEAEAVMIMFGAQR